MLGASVAGSLLVYGPLRAQTDAGPPPGPLILDMTFGARSLALGGALWTDDGAFSIFSHPALLSGEGFGVAHRRLGDATHMAASASRGWLDGTVSAGLSLLTYRGTASGAPGRPVFVHDLLDRGKGVALEFVAAVGFSRRVRGTMVGMAAKVVEQRMGGVRGSTAAVDIGVGRDLGPVTAALSIQNLGPGMDFGGHAAPLATRIVLGAGTGRTPLGPFDVGAAAQLARSGGGHLIPGGGVEVAWWPILRRTFIVRMGAVRVIDSPASPLTFGAGFEGDRIRIDYALTDHANGRRAARSHVIGLAFR